MKRKLLSILLTLTVVLTVAVVLGVCVSADVDLSGSTIVLSNGTAYQDTISGADITAQVAGMGLSYDSGTSTWMMTDFIFTTTAKTALCFEDQNVSVTVSGSNSLTAGTVETKSINGLEFGSDEATVAINGAASGTNTLTVTTVGTTAVESENWAISLEDASLTIGDNVTVTAVAGQGSMSSYGMFAVSLSMTGTGKLIVQADEPSDGRGVVLGAEPDVKVVNTVGGTEPTWVEDRRTYMNGSVYAKNITMTAKVEVPDYTIMLSGDKAYRNGSSGDDITAVVADMGLTYADGVWTMNNFNFTTTAGVALRISYSTTITVTGTNSLTGSDQSDAYGLYIDGYADNVTLQGTGSLTVTAGNALDSEGYSEGIYANGNLTVQGITLTAKSSAGCASYGMYNRAALTVEDATVTLTSGNGTDVTAGLRNSDDGTVSVTGTGKITATSGTTGDSNAAFMFNSDPQLTIADGNGNTLTWDSEDDVYKDGDGNIPTTAVLTAKVEVPDYAIVLSGDKAYKSMPMGNDINDTVAAMGLTYADGVWTMNNFNFTTTGTTALAFAGSTPITVEVIGDNSVTSGTSSYDSTYGIRIDADTTFRGSGTLTVNGGDTSKILTSYGLSATKNAVIEGITLMINGGVASDSDSTALSLYTGSSATLTVNNATVVCTGGSASGSSIGIYNNGFTIAVNGTGKLTAKMGVGEGGGYAINGDTDPQLTVVDGDGNALTWDSNDGTFKNAAGNIAATIILTSINPPPEIIEGAQQTIDVTKVNSATFKSSAKADKFVKVTVNGATLEAKYYLLFTGTANTVVSLNNEYISTLKNGTYTIEIVSTTGTASTTFTVSGVQGPAETTTAPETTTATPETTKATPETTKATPETTKATPETTTAKPETTTVAAPVTAPQTGVKTNLIVWFILLGSSLTGIACVFVIKTKKERQ